MSSRPIPPPGVVTGSTVGLIAAVGVVVVAIGVAVARVAIGVLAPVPPFQTAADSVARECDRARPEWIWCDDFEADRLARYFEVGRAQGRFDRRDGVGVGGSRGMAARWDYAGRVEAGFLHLAFGRTPSRYLAPVDGGKTAYREIYWRVYVRNPPGWVGGGGHKLSRAVVLADSAWATAALAHVWSGEAPGDRLVIDPASGTDAEGRVRTARYNDVENLRWLGAVPGKARLFAPEAIGTWHCVEAAARLNRPGARDGTFRLWVDGVLDAERTGLNWVGRFDAFGINALFIENYWNGGAPAAQERYLDRLIVSTAPIGCD